MMSIAAKIRGRFCSRDSSARWSTTRPVRNGPASAAADAAIDRRITRISTCCWPRKKDRRRSRVFVKFFGLSVARRKRAPPPRGCGVGDWGMGGLLF